MTLGERTVGRPPPDVASVSVRVKAEGGPVAPTVVQAAEVAAKLGTQREVLLLVHGFNNDTTEANAAYDKFMSLIADRVGARGIDFNAIGLVFWPGDADLGAIDALDFVSYPTDVRDALGSARVLAPFLAALGGPGGAPPRLTIVAHSLGCRVTLELLKLAGGLDVRAIFLMAAAVPVDLVEPGAELERAAGFAADRMVLYSPGDNVLRFAFPPGQGLAYTMGIERAPYAEAVGLFGEPDGFAPAVRCLRSYFTVVGEHGHYWRDDFVATTILDRLEGATRRLPMAVIDDRGLPPARELAARDIPDRTIGL